MESAIIGGVPQSLWFRGVSRSSPALILLHGGPAQANPRSFVTIIPSWSTISWSCIGNSAGRAARSARPFHPRP